MSLSVTRAGNRLGDALLRRAPGVVAAALVASVAHVAAGAAAPVFPIPAIVIALLSGILLSPLVVGPSTKAGLEFCVRTVLRWAVALLGLRVGLADIAVLGSWTAVLVVGSMLTTVVAGFAVARWCGLTAGFGALAGVGTAVCGASATLAVSTVVPDYPGKQADIVFVVVAVNALATVAMLAYPPICVLLGFGPQATGVMLGATIHDVAQVAGAGYAVSVPVGNTAVVVKLFRVFLLLPMVMGVGGCFARLGMKHGRARVDVPMFAVVFVLLCAVNSAMPAAPALLPIYAPVKSLVMEGANAGLLAAMAALGLTTSLTSIIGLGWRHLATVVAATVVLLVVVAGGLLLVPA